MEVSVTRHREFSAKYASERILKIGYHLLKLCPKSTGVVFSSKHGAEVHG